jgi:hypothetical protein
MASVPASRITAVLGIATTPSLTDRCGGCGDERNGAHSNQDDPSVGSGIGEELQIMLNPVPLLSSLRFQPTGSSEVAGRPALSAIGIPRPQDTLHGPAFELHELGAGADFYELEVDRQLEVLPAVTAIRDKQPFHRITTLAAAFDEPNPA